MTNLPVIIVEGQNDVTLFNNILIASGTDLDSVLIISPEIMYDAENKKGIVIKALNDLNYSCKISNSNKNKKVIGIVDSDYNKICNNCKYISNLFYTDYHDIDAQIFSTAAFTKFIYTYYWEPENVDLEKVRETCVKLAKEFGYYLLALYEYKLHREMKKLDPIYQYFDDDLNLKHTLILEEINQFEQNGYITADIRRKVEEKLHERRSQIIDDFQMTKGHDLIKILVMLTIWDKFNLKKKGISRNYKIELDKNLEKRKYLENELADLLRGSYELSFFKNSKLYENILIYQEKEKLVFILNS